jgi:hypothetical protein
MTRRDDQIDLCMNCVNIDRCSYYRNKKEPIIFCEEFTCDKPKVSSIHLDCLDDADMKPLDKAKQGLCINCRQMNSCNWEKNKIKFYCEEHE